MVGWSDVRLAPVLLLSAVAAGRAPDAVAEVAAPTGEVTLAVGVERVGFVDDHRLVLLSADDTAIVYDVGLGRVLLSVDLPAGATGLVVPPPPVARVYVPHAADAGGDQALTAVSVEAGTTFDIRFASRVAARSVQPTADGDLYALGSLGDVVYFFERREFEPEASGNRPPYPLGDSKSSGTFLKPGGARDLAYDPGSGLIFVSYEDPVVLAIDMSSSRPITDFTGGGTLAGRLQLAPLFAADAGRATGDFCRNSDLAAASPATGWVVLLHYDCAYGVVSAGGGVPLFSGKAGLPPDLPGRELVLAASASANRFAVARKGGDVIALFGYLGPSPERLAELDAGAPILDLALSPDGETAVAIVAAADGTGTAQLYAGISERFRQPAHGSAELLRRAQSALSELGYSVGMVDGVPGPMTTKAIKLFQWTQNLDPNGELDSETLKQLAESLGQSDYFEDSGSAARN